MANRHEKNEGASSKINLSSPATPAEWEIHPVDVKKLLDTGNLLLVDVRTPGEWDVARISGAILIPLAELESRAGEIVPPSGQPLVVHCHHGVRSLRAVQWLRGQGFAHAQSMKAGIDGWSLWVDPSVPRY